MPGATGHPLRIAIYARFSSHLQQPSSIDDQVRLCTARAGEIGGTVVRVHADRAATATTARARPGLAALLDDARHGRIDAILAEALDRISRDQEDIAGIHKRLRYWNVRLLTLEEGDVQAIHISIGGFMNQAWIDNLAAKTRRGQIGAVHAGRVPGGLSYGYRIANRIDRDGRPVRGLREIHPTQAETIRRIYRLYAGGASAREIAATLNAEGEPGPRGGPWASNTINGHRGRRNGILNNELYRGRLVHGRQRFVRDPDTGKRQARPVPEEEWIVKDVPELRIVDDALWQRVQDRRRAGYDRRNSAAPRSPLPLTGILRCAVCGGTMTIVKTRRYACNAHREKGTCGNPRGIQADRIENEVCSLLARHVADRDGLAALMRRAGEEASRHREKLTGEIADREARIRRLLDAVETGARPAAALGRIVEIERETAALEIELRALPDIPAAAPDGVAARLRERLAALDRAIRAPDTSRARRNRALLMAGSLIERIDVAPLPGRGQVDISLRPRTDALVALALRECWEFETGKTGCRDA